MLSTTIYGKLPASKAPHLAKLTTTTILRLTSTHSTINSISYRPFSTTPHNYLKDIFPVKETDHIATTKPAWPHHGYTYEEMKAVVPAHRPPRTFSDWAAWKIVRMARWCMDTATGMDRQQKSDKKNPTTNVVAEKPLTEAQWVCTLLWHAANWVFKYACQLTPFLNSLFDSSSWRALLVCQAWLVEC